jgi:hexaprenyl-diphosphate synthase
VDVLNLSAHPGASDADPFAVVAADLAGVNHSIKGILGVDHPVLARVAQYFFNWEGGKQMRPAMVLLMARAVNAHMHAVNDHFGSAGSGGRAAAAAGGRAADVRGWNPGAHDPRVSYTSNGMPQPLARALQQRADAAAAAGGAAPTSEAPSATLSVPLPPAAVFPLQQRLAEVTEMIHTASLLHDDVIDTADTRRGLSSANSVFGNKLAVLAGDFLLARASVSLARLRSIPVVELLSTVIEHLVKGEVMQMKSAATAGAAAATREAFEMYLRKKCVVVTAVGGGGCRG